MFDVIYEDLIVTLLTLHVLSWFGSVVRFSKPRYIYYNHCSIQFRGGGLSEVHGEFCSPWVHNVFRATRTLSLTLIFVWDFVQRWVSKIRLQTLFRLVCNLVSWLCYQCNFYTQTFPNFLAPCIVVLFSKGPEKNEKMRVHLENLEISWNFEKLINIMEKLHETWRKLGGY